ncbi:MAG: 5'-nucleotidase C-terminal domain-containing protein [Leptolyngbyaceae cyanobacterium T60_A2020_046]|nr:5'-nucleotidase C-terminal domain-containing protein [Leptolyngbyaceae cyanobacterium T60_A2020_046]
MSNLRAYFKGGIAGLLVALMSASPVQAFTLTILHNNDSESKLLPVTASDGNLYGGIDQFVQTVNTLRANSTTDGVLTLSSGDNFLAGAEFNASLTNGVYDVNKAFDARALAAINYDAIVLGNHDFDFGPSTLSEFINVYRTLAGPNAAPFLSSNLDFTGEPLLQGLVDNGGIAKSTVVETGGERIAIVGATTPLLPTISSPGNVGVNPNVRETVQAEIDRLLSEGVNKIVFVSHLQAISEDEALVAQLRGVDIAIAGGGEELLANPGTELIPGDTARREYPILVNDADGRPVPVVTTNGDYSYVGQLKVTFDDDGNLTDIDLGSGPVRIEGLGDPQVRAEIVEPVQAAVLAQAQNTVAITEVPLDGRRVTIRSRETNEGNLIADALRWQAEQSSGQPVDIALQNGGGIRNDNLFPSFQTIADLPEGSDEERRTKEILAGADRNGNNNGITDEITELSTINALPFANFVSVFKSIDVSTIKNLLENAIAGIGISPEGEPTGTPGAFPQISGFRYEFNPTLEVGKKVITLALENGDVLVEGGNVIDNRTLSVAANSFSARGGDDYDWGNATFENLGVSYQQALLNYLTAPTSQGGLGGQVTAAQYPVGGEGRIQFTNGVPTTPGGGDNGGGDNGGGDDPVSVPEPSAVLGLIAIAAGARQLRKRQTV